MTASLADGGRIEIRGFGSFSLRFRPARVARNPRTGSAVALPARHAAYFKPGSKLRERVKAFSDDDRVCDDVAHGFLARLDALRLWRNALCHGAWQGFATDDSTSLRHFRKGDDGPEQLDDRLTLATISSIRAETISLTLDVVDIVSAAGVRFPGTALPGIDLSGCMKDHRD